MNLIQLFQRRLVIVLILATLPICVFAQTSFDSQKGEGVFSDVPPESWYYESVMRAYELGLMYGTNLNEFSPEKAVSRAYVVSIFYKIEGSPYISENCPFEDVPLDRWYAKAVAWAASAGICIGNSDDSFDPDGEVTLEQLSVIIHRYALFKGLAVKQDNDASEISIIMSPWAEKSVEWALAAKLLYTSDNLLDTRQSASRAQLAYMITNFIQASNVGIEKPAISSAIEEGQFRTGSGEKFNYLLYNPKNPTDGMPLVTFLHGGYGHGYDVSLLTSYEGVPRYILDGRLGNIPAYILMPVLPGDKNSWSDAKGDLKELIEHLIELYKINPDRVSLTGFSRGAVGTWDVASAYPEMFSCIAPVAGVVDTPDMYLKSLSDTPIWAFTGSADTDCPQESTVSFMGEMRRYNPGSKITILEDQDHYQVLTFAFLSSSINLVNWLISKSR